MKKEKGLPKLVVFGVLTTVTAFAWVGFEIYRAYTVRPEPVVPPEVLQSLDPNLDLLILEGLVNKVYLEDEEIGVNFISAPEVQLEEELPQEEILEEELPEEFLELLQDNQATESAQN